MKFVYRVSTGSYEDVELEEFYCNKDKAMKRFNDVLAREQNSNVKKDWEEENEIRYSFDVNRFLYWAKYNKLEVLD